MIPGVVVNLGGTDYTVPPLSLGAIELFQTKLETFSGNPLDASTRTLAADIIACALRRNYPEITRKTLLGEYKLDESTGELLETAPPLLDLANLQEVMAAVMDVSGLRRKEQEAGKLKAGTTP